MISLSPILHPYLYPHLFTLALTPIPLTPILNLFAPALTPILLAGTLTLLTLMICISPIRHP